MRVGEPWLTTPPRMERPPEPEDTGLEIDAASAMAEMAAREKLGLGRNTWTPDDAAEAEAELMRTVRWAMGQVAAQALKDAIETLGEAERVYATVADPRVLGLRIRIEQIEAIDGDGRTDFSRSMDRAREGSVSLPFVATENCTHCCWAGAGLRPTRILTARPIR